MTNHATKCVSELPTKLRNKISCDGVETTDCWLWTGSFTKPRPRPRDGRPTLANERGTPMVHEPTAGYPVNAIRVVYAAAREVPLNLVPRLGRCLDDRCVSPHHVQERGPVVKGSPHAAALREMEKLIPKEHTPPHPRPQLVGDPNVEQPDATLRRCRPENWLTIESAEDECKLPRGSITPAVWAAYVAWDEVTPVKE